MKNDCSDLGHYLFLRAVFFLMPLLVMAAVDFPKYKYYILAGSLIFAFIRRYTVIPGSFISVAFILASFFAFSINCTILGVILIITSITMIIFGVRLSLIRDWNMHTTLSVSDISRRRNVESEENRRIAQLNLSIDQENAQLRKSIKQEIKDSKFDKRLVHGAITTTALHALHVKTFGISYLVTRLFRSIADDAETDEIFKTQQKSHFSPYQDSVLTQNIKSLHEKMINFGDIWAFSVFLGVIAYGGMLIGLCVRYQSILIKYLSKFHN